MIMLMVSFRRSPPFECVRVRTKLEQENKMTLFQIFLIVRVFSSRVEEDKQTDK